MAGAAWFIAIFVSCGMIVAFVATFVPFYARYRAYQHAVYLRVDLPSRLEHTVSARLMARERGASVGAFASTVGATLALVVGFGPGGDDAFASWFIIGALLAGAGVGTAVSALTTRTQVAADLPRVARSGAATVADYLAPFERIGARIVVVLAVVAAIAVSVVAPPDAGSSAVGVVFFAAAGVVSLALFEIASRRIVDLSQPAGSTAELVWDDAVRASTLRDLVTGPLALGAYGLIFGSLGLAEGGTGPASTVGYVSGGIVVATLVVTAVVSLVSRPARYFLTRLWPNLRWSDTADQTVEAA